MNRIPPETPADLGKESRSTRLLGPAEFACLACGGDGLGRVLGVREMNLGLGDTFHYGVCTACRSLTLIDPPADLRPYYPPSDYYSLRSRWPVAVADRAFRSRISFGGHPRAIRWLARFELDDTALGSLGRLRLSPHTAILDVGAGSGRLVDNLVRLGFRATVGVDPFLPPGTGATGRLRRGGLGAVGDDERFDLIMFHHSLEHTSDPSKELRRAAQLLSESGSLLLRLPLAAAALERYGACWYGIDAPRHSFVPTPEGLDRLLQRTGFRALESYRDSTSAQFTVSADFQAGGSARRRHAVAPVVLVRDRLSRAARDAVRAAALANANGTGDQIVLYARLSR